jgi:riboflavin kinase/FMN adenylyltransferase
MQVVDAVHRLPTQGAVVAIGNFDGVHLGHRALLRRMRAWADAEGRPAAIVTFFPPAKVLFQGMSYLASREEKLTLLEPFAPDAVAMIRFDRAYARTDKSAFLAELAELSPHAIVVGEDFRFGRHRAGGLDDLQHVPERLEVFGLEHHGGAPISSSRIREHLLAGEIEAARRLLGAPYLAIGEVVEGDRRGRTIGFPTANLDLPVDKALPIGVFAVQVDTPAGRFGGMSNVGPRPSFPDGAPRLEAHLFDVDADLYGQRLAVRFVTRLRGQRRFDGLDDLVAQLRADRDAARAALDADAAR